MREILLQRNTEMLAILLDHAARHHLRGAREVLGCVRLDMMKGVRSNRVLPESCHPEEWQNYQRPSRPTAMPYASCRYVYDVCPEDNAEDNGLNECVQSEEDVTCEQ